MSVWKVILATLVIFAAGFLVGGLVVNKTTPTAPAAAKPGGTLSGNPGQFRLQALQHRMDRELNLTPEQDAQIHQIIADSQERVGTVWKPVAQQIGKETQDACDQIRDVLTDEQKAKFDALSKERPDERGWHRPGGATNHFFTNIPH